MNFIQISRNIQRSVAVSAIAIALQCVTATAQTGLTDVKAPSVPPELEAPAGNTPFLKAHAVGTQNYICLPTGWTFLGPQATLFVSIRWINGEVRQQVATHFLSVNPFESDNKARPAWQSSLDTSGVWGNPIGVSTDPNYVAPGAIPWLLLEVVGAQRGPTNGSLLSQTTYIQRVNTSGGLKPATACTVGSTAFVPYTTDYVFYKASR